MPSIILDDFFGDTKIELQLAHKSSVDDKNLHMIHKVFGEIVKLKDEIKKHKKFRQDLYEVCNIDERHTDEYIISVFRDIEESDEYQPHPKVVVDIMNDIINQVETREWKRVNDHRERVVKKMKNQSQKIENWKTATGEAEDRLDEQMLLNENMKDDWAVATEKIGQENSDLHNEIKRLKKSHADTCSYWRIKVMSVEEENKCLKNELSVKHPVIFQKTYQLQRDEIEKLKDENEKLKAENEKLQNRIEDAEQRGFDEGRDQYQVDSEYLDEKEDEIKRLRELIEKLKENVMDEYGD
jgi:hypothetical protein